MEKNISVIGRMIWISFKIISSALKSLQKQELVVVDEEAFLVREVLFARWMAKL